MVNSGIVFIANNTRIPAALEHVLPQYRRNAIGKDGIVIETIEHLMAALNGLGIDNIDVAITTFPEGDRNDGNGIYSSFEIPNTDGSSEVFTDLLLQAGMDKQDAPRRILRITQPVEYQEGDCRIAALPADDDCLTIDYTFSHAAQIIGTQRLAVKLTHDSFISEIARARTFCMADEAAALQAQGIGKTANYQNLLVVDNDRIVDNTLRFRDEFARHKILDLMGDLYLLNAGLIAKVIAVRTGHKQNIEFARKLARKSD